MALALAQAVVERGISGVGVSVVSSRAKVSRRTFYAAFADIEACRIAAFDEGMAAAAAAIAPACRAAGGWRGRMRVALSALLTLLDEQPGLGRYCVVESLGAGQEVQLRRLQARRALVTAIDAGRECASVGATLTPLTAEGVLGAILAIVQARLIGAPGEPIAPLHGELMGILVRPYLGPRAVAVERARAVPSVAASVAQAAPGARVPARASLPEGVRLTYRTMRTIEALASRPGGSNREIAELAGIKDPGQASRLLARLQRRGFALNEGGPASAGVQNAWRLTERGSEVAAMLSERGDSARPAADRFTS